MKNRAILAVLFFVASTSCGCQEERDFSELNKIGKLYIDKYENTSDYITKAELEGIKSILSSDYGFKEINDWERVFCALEKKRGVIENPATKKYISQKIVASIHINDVPCRENIFWYLENIQISNSEPSPFIEIIASDAVEYFSASLRGSSYETMLREFPELHIYMAYRNSCKVLERMYSDVEKSQKLRVVLTNDLYKEYADRQCGI